MKNKLIILSIIFVLLLLAGSIIYDSDTVTIYVIAIYWIVTVLYLTVAGNMLIYFWLNRKLPWEKETLRRMVYQLLLSGIYIMVCTNISYYIFKTNYTEFPPDNQQMILLNIYGLFIIIPVFSIFFGIFFMTKWKRATVQVEEAKKEVLHAELLALKNHLDPHFLFNNLNILSSLIDTDNEPAQDFLEKFAEVYRYVLKIKDAEIIQLSDELEFLESYLYLMNTRFDEQLEVEIDIKVKDYKQFIPILTLQMLVENALKHNSFSADNKLHISIKSVDNGLRISNNYQQRDFQEKSWVKGSGLTNIEKRYELLASQKPTIYVKEGLFIVDLPLITAPK